MGIKHQSSAQNLEVIGHRGHVSTYPENTVEGFISLLDTGAEALELDLVISADKEVVVSHEPYMAAAYMSKPDGSRIKKSEEKTYQLYGMTYDSIRRFDSGSRFNLKFPFQKRIPTYKPLLREVFSKIEAHSNQHEHPGLKYYLELKSQPSEYGITQPPPGEFAQLVMEVVQKNNMEQRVILQSFDAQLLNEVHKKYPQVTTSFLLYKKSIEEGLSELDFQPDIISPYFKQIKNRERVLQLQKQGFKVLPWTVNRKLHIKRMMNYGVDGIISDYPEKVLKLKKRRSN
ncbi:glycerophosphodiester phosphodiesterase family protein [Salinimicrobium xinjiangense]|uniref:glycerophosphodiester phosphodiesterase family protein n=1 Tax=Salinimicrobium xinjiangense TaxID=438596 RepID=UPI00146BF81E|nr:glycerophosphodiester phosphodiesterase family protein [Salinimicrobium xinjiangense]